MAKFIVTANEVRRIRGHSGVLEEHWETVRQVPTFYVDAYNESEARTKANEILRSSPDASYHLTIEENG